MVALRSIMPGRTANHLPLWTSKNRRKIAAGRPRSRGRGQLLRPDEDTVPVRAALVDDERRPVAFEIRDAELEVLEIHPLAVEVYGGVPALQSEEPERQRHPDDPPVVRIEGH